MARSMADGSRMVLCMMMLALLAFNPMSLLNRRSPSALSGPIGEAPGRTILEDLESENGESNEMDLFVGVKAASEQQVSKSKLIQLLIAVFIFVIYSICYQEIFGS